MGVSSIKLARLRSGMRQWDLAKQIGISETQLSKIETGRVKPGRDLLVRIAAALGVAWETLESDEDGAGEDHGQ